MKNNVLFVVIDSTIKEFYDFYDSSEKITPNIAELAEKGMIFEDANSAGVWTPASHGAIFSGKMPSRTNSIIPDLELDEENTIASQLSKNSYSTSAIVTAAHITPEAGYDAGFDEYILTYKDIDRKTLDFSVWKDTIKNRLWGRRNRTIITTDLVKERIQGLESPWFIFTNYSTAHRPYKPPFHLKKKFEASVGNKSKMKELMESNEAGLTQNLFEEYDLKDQDYKLLKSWFKAELNRADKHIGRLINQLKKEGLFEETLIIITSDHGDEFGEHGLFGHSALYETTLNVPLVMTGPNVPKGRTDKSVSLIDLMPTILDLTESQIPSDLDGKKLFPLEEYDREKVIAESGEREFDEDYEIAQRINPPSKSIKRGKYKLIHRKSAQDELYNIQSDPDEEKNIIQKKRKLANELREELPDFESNSNKEEMLDSEDEEIKKRLEELGYT